MWTATFWRCGRSPAASPDHGARGRLACPRHPTSARVVRAALRLEVPRRLAPGRSSVRVPDRWTSGAFGRRSASPAGSRRVGARCRSCQPSRRRRDASRSARAAGVSSCAGATAARDDRRRRRAAPPTRRCRRCWRPATRRWTCLATCCPMSSTTRRTSPATSSRGSRSARPTRFSRWPSSRSRG